MEALLHMPARLPVDLRNERTGRVHRPKAAIGRPIPDGEGDPVGGEDHDAALRDLVDGLDEDRPLRPQAVDDAAVVDDLVADVDGRAEDPERALHDLDGPIRPGAESPGHRKHDLHVV